MYFNIEIGILD